MRHCFARFFKIFISSDIRVATGRRFKGASVRPEPPILRLYTITIKYGTFNFVKNARKFKPKYPFDFSLDKLFSVRAKAKIFRSFNRIFPWDFLLFKIFALKFKFPPKLIDC